MPSRQFPLCSRAEEVRSLILGDQAIGRLQSFGVLVPVLRAPHRLNAHYEQLRVSLSSRNRSTGPLNRQHYSSANQFPVALVPDAGLLGLTPKLANACF